MPKLNNKYLILIGIVLIGLFLRFYRILDFPVQLNHDEVSQLYDAISIAQTGKDIYSNFLPTIFPSVQDYKSPFYTYITALLYLIIGGGELTIKLPGAIFGSLAILAVYLFVLNLFKNSKIALLSSFLTAIAPFEIFFSRKSFESVAGIFFMILGFATLLKFTKKQSDNKMLFVSSILIAVAAYTYFSHAIIIPLLLFTFVLIYRESFLKNFKQVLLPMILLIVLLIPILIIIVTNPDARYRSQTVFVTQDVNLGKNIEYAQIKTKAILDFSFNRYLSQFNINYIFGNGLEFTHQGPLDQGLLLLVQMPFLFLGIIYLIRIKDFIQEKKFIFAWILIGMLPSGLTFEQQSPHRSIMVFTMLNIISAIGVFYFLKFIYEIQKNGKLKRILFTALILAFSLNYLYFIHMYFVNFPFEKSQNIQYPFKEVARFAWQNHDSFDQIIFDPLFGETAPVIGTAAHYYLAYYGNFPPAKFQQEYRPGEKVREVLFDKFSIRKIDWREDQNLKKVLLIGSGWSLPINSIDKSKIIKTFYFYNKQPAFYAITL